MFADVIRVILADDHSVVRAGLHAMLGGFPDIEVVADAANGIEAVACVAQYTPDVVVMDLSMDQMDGLSATRAIVASESATRVLVLTMHAEEEYLLAALDAGASGYLVKSAAERELVDAIRALAHGDMYVQPSAARVLAGRLQHDAPGAEDRRRLALLSEREVGVLRLVAAGHTGPRIAGELAISTKTVDTYKQRINDKLGLTGRPAYVRFALRVGLLGLDTRPLPLLREI
jgi:DNA-binding NarL/FixJ family response regulator